MKNRTKIVYQIFVGAILCHIGINAFAQETKLKRENFLTDYVFQGNHVQFNFATFATLKARLKKESGSHPVTTKPALGFLLSFKYQVNYNNEFSLIVGPEATLLGRNLITSFKKNDFSPALENDYELKGINSYVEALVLSLPVLVEKRWLYANTKFLFANTGVRLNFSTGADFDIFSISLPHTGNGFHNAGNVNVNANNDAKPWISFPLNVGHSWLLRNNNLLQLAICSNISFTKYVKGTYNINIPGQPVTTGAYSSTGSYIGLSMNYIFTSANYRIRKAYEKQEKKSTK